MLAFDLSLLFAIASGNVLQILLQQLEFILFFMKVTRNCVLDSLDADFLDFFQQIILDLALLQLMQIDASVIINSFVILPREGLANQNILVVLFMHEFVILMHRRESSLLIDFNLQNILVLAPVY